MRRLAALSLALLVASLPAAAQQRAPKGPGVKSQDSTWTPGTYDFGAATGGQADPTGTTGTQPPVARTPATWVWGPVQGSRYALNTTGWLANGANYWSDAIQEQWCTGDECPYARRTCYVNYDLLPSLPRPLYMTGAIYYSPVTTGCLYEQAGNGGRDFPFPVPVPPGTHTVGWDGVWKNPDGTPAR